MLRSRPSFSALELAADRPARAHVVVALVLGLALVAIPLYLWRRPRADARVVPLSLDGGALSLPAADGASGRPTRLDDRGLPSTKPTFGPFTTLLCQKPGRGSTAAEDCDPLVDVERALASAIAELAPSCIPPSGGAAHYVAEVNFKKASAHVVVPTCLRCSPKVMKACSASVTAKLQALPLASMAHTHVRYKVAVTATYPAPVASSEPR